MSLPRILCLLAALVFGISATSVAQVADPRGIRIKIVSPDSAGYAGIGKRVIVHVLRTITIAPALDSVIVVLRSDTLRSAGTLTVNAATTADTINTQTILGNGGAVAHSRFVRKLAAPQSSSTTGVDSFKFTFTVTEGDPEANSVIAQVFVLETGTTAFKKLNNLNRSQMSDITGFTDPVGDKKFVRIDGVRPLAGAVFTSVVIDTIGVRKFKAEDPEIRSFKIGDTVKIQANVQNFNAAKARFAIYQVDRLTSPDSVLYVKDIDAAAVISSVGGVRDSFTLTPGQFKAVKAGASTHSTTNLRAKVVGFLVDNAGNVSLNNPAPGVAGALSPDITYVFDTTAPIITLTYPDSTSRRFTGLKDTSLAIRLNDGSLPGINFTLNPLKFKVDEGVTVRWAIAGTDTAKYAGTDSANVDLTYTTVEKFSASRGQAAGSSVDLSVVVTDSVGNKTTKTVTGVIHDQVAPIISNLFPSSTVLMPDKKINNITRHPVFRINEEADTISVRYVQVGAFPPKVVTQAVSSSKLSIVNQDIAVTVNDSLIDDERFNFQIFIRDKAKNVNVTASDTLTFDKEFINPVADSFLVNAALTTVSTGQNMVFTVTAIDSKLTRAAGQTRKAVTYNKRGVLLRVDAGTQDQSQITFGGTGVTDNGNGTANLNAEDWFAGERSLTLKSIRPLTNFRVIVEDTSTTIVDGNPTKVVNFKGTTNDLNILLVPNTETTLATGLLGQTPAGVGSEVPIFKIGFTGDGNATVNAVTLTLSDLSSATGLAQGDFSELRFYRSNDAILDEGDQFIGSLAQNAINLGAPSAITATTPDVPSEAVERFYIVTAVVNPNAIPGRAFKVGFAAGGLATSVGGRGSVVLASDANRVVVTSVLGHVHYFDDPSLGVEGVTANLSPQGLTVTTNGLGNYTFPPTLPENFEIELSKPFNFLASDARQAITGSDALKVLQSTAFLLQSGLTADEKIVGDINSDGFVSNADAIGILRYLAFLNTNIGSTGTWRFLPDRIFTVSNFSFPTSRAFLMGDVNPSFGRASKPIVLAEIGKNISDLLNISSAKWKEDRLILPIQVMWDEPVQSLVLTLNYDPALFSYEAVRLTDAGQKYLMVDNGEKSGTIHIALAGPSAEVSEQPIIEVALRRIGQIESVLQTTQAEVDISRFVLNDILLPVGPEARLVVERVPNQFELTQNYPNPFNPQTEIQFGLPEKSRIKLTIYNVMGQQVRVLIDEELRPGFHRVVWDGRTTSGSLVASGVYLYHLQAEAGFSKVKRMMLLK